MIIYIYLKYTLLHLNHAQCITFLYIQKGMLHLFVKKNAKLEKNHPMR